MSSNSTNITVTSSGVAVVAPADCSAIIVQQAQGSDPPSVAFSVYSDAALANKIADVAAGQGYQFSPSGLAGAAAFASGQTVGYVKVASGTYVFTATVVPLYFNRGGNSNALQYAGPQQDALGQLLAADGAITIKSGTCVITKATACAATLAAPVSGTDDGKILCIIAGTNAAHTVTQNTPGFNNGGGASDVATFGGTPAGGGSLVLEAYKGAWLVRGMLGVTLA